MTEILAIDPGKLSGYAVFMEDRPVRSGFIHVRTAKGAMQIWELFCWMTGKAADWTMVIEGPHPIPRNKAGKPKFGWRTLYGMGIPRGQWEQNAQMRSMKIIEVLPSAWQLPTIGRGLRKQQIKKYVMRAQAIMKTKEFIQSDEAAAICMGDWYIRELGRKPWSK
jgi:hypothetical protein